ncbi:MAG: hypothetical protein OXS35_06505 [Dehalococcoidia bacterium]|nr:hypothetical protein [Dehalococcoidia bacterium]
MRNDNALGIVVAGAVVVVAAAIFLHAVIESGFLPWAVGLGVVAIIGTLVASRQWLLSLWAGGVVAATVATIGAFNVLAPGWYQNLI